VVVASVAIVPPSSSVLPPGAGNEAEKASKTELEGPKKLEEGYVEAAIDGNVHAAAVRRDDDGDAAMIPTVEQAHTTSENSAVPDADTLGEGSLAGLVNGASCRGRSCPGTEWRIHAPPAAGRWYAPNERDRPLESPVLFIRAPGEHSTQFQGQIQPERAGFSQFRVRLTHDSGFETRPDPSDRARTRSYVPGANV